MWREICRKVPVDRSTAAKMLLSVRLERVTSSRVVEMAWTEEMLPHDVMGVGRAAVYVASSGTRILKSFLLPQSSAVR